MASRNLYNLCLVALLMVAASCHDEVANESRVEEPDVILPGDKVLFSACMPQPEVTRGDAKARYDELMARFESVAEDYVFTVEMYEQDAEHKIGEAVYMPLKDVYGEVTKYDPFGTLVETAPKAGETSNEPAALYWNSNQRKYAFHAYAGSDTLVSDQSAESVFFAMDRIEGYGYVRGWDQHANNGEGASKLNLDGLNFLTSKEWYASNKAYELEKGGMSSDPDFLKKVPLYMRHKRARITVLLEAGEGVERSQLELHDNTEEELHAEIYSYNDEDELFPGQPIKPILSSYECDYTPDVADDPENTCLNVRYDAIVNPHNYASDNNLTDQKILGFNLSGMKFSFYAANDEAYVKSLNTSLPEDERAELHESVLTRYNLQAGQHLILRVILSSDTRKILITAYVVDWEDFIYSTICDDFGQSGNPVKIETKEQLAEFLSNPSKNKPGNVGIITPLTLSLIDSNGGWNPTNEQYELKATLKLAGATIITDKPLFTSIAPTGSIVNGTIQIAGNADAPAIECAITQENYGNIERMKIERATDCQRRLTRAGVAVTNYGTIYRCESSVPVYNPGGDSELYVGGIAAEVKYRLKSDHTADLTTIPVIDQCTVNARVDGGANVKGGGIVGYAEGQVSNNTFEYGITLLQNSVQFKNIIHTKGEQELTHFDNQWPTLDDNNVTNGDAISNVRTSLLRYTKVIDSQAELEALLKDNVINKEGNSVRLADSFTINNTDTTPWDYGIQDNDHTTSNKGNLFCRLNGNQKTITLTGDTEARMIFSHISNEVYDLNVDVLKPIVAAPKESGTDAEKLPARAPLAYALVGSSALLRNVSVNMQDGAYVETTSPAGLVVWVYDNATVDHCQSNADVRIVTPTGSGSQATYFVGGLVYAASKATISNCTYLRSSLDDSQRDLGDRVYFGGIVGGTEKKGMHGDQDESSYPMLTISDCVSWLGWSATEEHPSWGGIIGYSKYQPAASHTLLNGMSNACQGNYWIAPSGASPLGMASGMTEEKVIGKKNSVVPSAP